MCGLEMFNCSKICSAGFWPRFQFQFKVLVFFSGGSLRFGVQSFVKKLRFEVGMTDGWGNQNIIFCVQSNSNITIINCTSINLWNVKRKKQNFLRLFFVFCHLVSTWIINLGNILLINPRQRIHPTPFWLFLNQIVLVRNHYHLSPHHCNYLEELCPLQIKI